MYIVLDIIILIVLLLVSYTLIPPLPLRVLAPV